MLVDFGQRFLTCRPVSILPFPVIGAITLSFTSVLLQPWEVFLIFLHVNPGENEDKGGRRVVEYLQIPELIALTRTCIYPQHGHRVTLKTSYCTHRAREWVFRSAVRQGLQGKHLASPASLTWAINSPR